MADLLPFSIVLLNSKTKAQRGLSYMPAGFGFQKMKPVQTMVNPLHWLHRKSTCWKKTRFMGGLSQYSKNVTSGWIFLRPLWYSLLTSIDKRGPANAKEEDLCQSLNHRAI
jgi:hypothetical protein